jgi:hypothetical protein
VTENTAVTHRRVPVELKSQEGFINARHLRCRRIKHVLHIEGLVGIGEEPRIELLQSHHVVSGRRGGVRWHVEIIFIIVIVLVYCVLLRKRYEWGCGRRCGVITRRRTHGGGRWHVEIILVIVLVCRVLSRWQ